MIVRTVAAACTLSLMVCVAPAFADDQTHLPVAPTIDTVSAAKGGEVASQAVVRIICAASNSAGTGFLHKSGRIITAAHVVANCPAPLVSAPDGTQIEGQVEAQDVDIDLAIVSLNRKWSVAPLPISTAKSLQVGEQLSAWGFPGGYGGLSPMLTVGYLSAEDARRTASGRIIRQWVVNAAFNSGNSGGPVIDARDGTVVGVVDAKLAPLSSQTLDSIQLLSNEQSGFLYSGTKPDGSTFQISQAQILGAVLDDLRRQIQLVVGYAIKLPDLKTFLISHGIDP